MAAIKKLFFIILLFSTTCSRASESDGLHRYSIGFVGPKSVIEYKDAASSRDGVDMRLITDKSDLVMVGHYPPEGASPPAIVSVFKACAPEKLFVIVSWSADIPALNTGGSIYEVFAYDPQIININGVKSLHSNDSLARKFGVGFDGLREGRKVTYKYKKAAVVKQQLNKWGCR
ncbi:hypothetical protein [Cupriavidus pauculus]|uniref:hypothetical protein n=1 Tax=Cupriavidus pauculus TaxID=82633 RepID=UPI00203BC7EC|nr:hypothetical protein [Cupriavidus pauculus]MCM3607678.1 hypothetical protein [Cupriavidus pauculus]